MREGEYMSGGNKCAFLNLKYLRCLFNIQVELLSMWLYKRIWRSQKQAKTEIYTFVPPSERWYLRPSG